jgi:hypothetical protein
MTTATPKLTKLQLDVLAALRDGQLIVVDKSNMPWLGDRALQPQTRYFLTKNRLITRRDPTTAVETNGNGFTISSKGLAWLEANAPAG